MKKTINPANIKLNLLLKVYRQSFNGDPQLERKMALLKESFLDAQKASTAGQIGNKEQFLTHMLVYLRDAWYSSLKNKDGFLKVVNNHFQSLLEIASVQNTKHITNQPNPSEAFQQIVVDFNGCLQRGLEIPLTTITEQATPEDAYAIVEAQLARYGIKMVTNLGSYGIVATDNEGNNENYVGIAGRFEPIKVPQPQKDADGNEIFDNLHEGTDRDGYPLGHRGISARNIYELWSMRPGNKTQFGFQRDSQYGRVSIIHVAPIAEISDSHARKMLEPNKTHKYEGENYLADYLSFLESYSMGLLNAFGIVGNETGLNIKEAENKKAFLAGFSVRYPKTYKDLIVFSEKHMRVSSWSQDYARGLMAIQLLAETNSKGLKHAANRDPSRKDGSADTNIIDATLNQRNFETIQGTGKLYFHYWQDFYKTLIDFNEFQRDKGPIRALMDSYTNISFPGDISHEKELKAQKVYTDFKKIKDLYTRLMNATELIYDQCDKKTHERYMTALCDHTVHYYVRSQGLVTLPKKYKGSGAKEIEQIANNKLFTDPEYEPDLDIDR